MRIRFINEDDGKEVVAENLRIVLPDNRSFVIEAEPGRDGAAVFPIPGGKPQDQTFNCFSIEPGAANLFSVKVVEFARPRRDIREKREN